jgi:hypothetical protein
MGEVTVYHILINVVIWFIAMLFTFEHIFNVRANGMGYKWLLLLLVVFSTFAFCTGDYLNYRLLYNDTLKYNSSEHFEELYAWLIEVLPREYHVWRFVVWGLASIVLIWTYKKLKLPQNFAVMVFVVLLMPVFPNLRNALGYVVVLLAIAFLADKQSSNRSWCILVAFALLAISTFLHKSMFLYIVLALFAFIPLNRVYYLLLLILFPILYLQLYGMSSAFIDVFATSEFSGETGHRYLDSDLRSTFNIYGIIQLTLNRLPVLLLLFYIIKNTVYTRKIEVSFYSKVYTKYTFILIYMSFLFYGQNVSAFLSSRFWDASLFPVTIVIADFWENRPRSKFFKFCMILLIVASFYNFSHAMYSLVK